MPDNASVYTYSSSFPGVSHVLPFADCHGGRTGPSDDTVRDARYAPPFRIERETFPVPTAVPGAAAAAAWRPGAPLRVAYVSWNMAHREPNLPEVAAHCIHPNAHIIAVCTQENGSRTGRRKQQRVWTNFVEKTCLGGEYKLVGRGRLWFVELLVFARRRDVAWRVCHVEVSNVKTGLVYGLGGNKGGVGIALVLSMRDYSHFHIQHRDQGDVSYFSNCAFPAKERENVRESVLFPEIKPSTSVNVPYITVLFIGAHLAAHQEAVELRNKDYHTIARSLRLGCKGRKKNLFQNLLVHKFDCTQGKNGADKERKNGSDAHRTEFSADHKKIENETDDTLDLPLMRLPMKTSVKSNIRRDVTEEFDLTFFGGDLNYRINGTRKAIEHIVEKQKDIRSILVHNDQLNLEKAKGAVFHGFHEGNLLFRPTYKYEIQNDVTTNEYDLSKEKNRMPAYCDRVLYKKRKNSRAGNVKIKLYTDVADVRTSDHRPVVALFELSTEAHL